MFWQNYCYFWIYPWRALEVWKAFLFLRDHHVYCLHGSQNIGSTLFFLFSRVHTEELLYMLLNPEPKKITKTKWIQYFGTPYRYSVFIVGPLTSSSWVVVFNMFLIVLLFFLLIRRVVLWVTKIVLHITLQQTTY